MLQALTDEMARGEAVVIIEVTADSAAQALAKPNADELLQAAITDGEDRKTALRRIAKQTGKSRRALYARWTTLCGPKSDS